jgi:hypothetical protein
MFSQEHQRREGFGVLVVLGMSHKLYPKHKTKASVQLLPKCWMCVQVGHLKTYCHQKWDLPGNGRYPRGGQASQAVVLSGLQNVTAATNNVPT